MRLRNLLAGLALASIVVAGFPDSAGAAASPQANCTGEFVSTMAGPDFGPLVASSVQAAAKGAGQSQQGAWASTNCGMR